MTMICGSTATAASVEAALNAAFAKVFGPDWNQTGENFAPRETKDRGNLRAQKFTDSEFMQLYHQGLTGPQMAARLGVRKRSIYVRAQYLGVTFKPGARS